MHYDSIDELSRARPEWQPWLALVRIAVGEIEHADWRETRCDGQSAPASGAPCIARSTILAREAGARRLLDEMARVARSHGSSELAATADALAASASPLTTLEAAVNRRLSDATDAILVGALGALVAMPVLHACSRAADIPAGWPRGYCPVCGSWPAFAEVHGVERSRALRCADCGSAWAADPLSCVFCGNADHERLGSLMIEQSAGAGIEVCDACRGYLKVFTTLRACAPAQVLLRDLATAEIDMAAAARGRVRAPRAPHARDVEVRASVGADA